MEEQRHTDRVVNERGLNKTTGNVFDRCERLDPAAVSMGSPAMIASPSE